MTNVTDLISELDRQRAASLQVVKHLEAAIEALRGLNSSDSKVTKTPTPATGARPKRHMSVAARKRIAAAQRVRWAKWKAEQKKAA